MTFEPILEIKEYISPYGQKGIKYKATALSDPNCIISIVKTKSNYSVGVLSERNYKHILKDTDSELIQKIIIKLDI